MTYEVPRHEEQLHKGQWSEEEDETLMAAVALLGERRWDALAKASGLRRSGKSCRLRWLNYLRPNLKHGEITEEEELIIIQLHEIWGNKWAKIARRLPGRTDNEIKNYWRTHLRKKLTQAQGQETFSSVTSDAKQYSLLPLSDGVTNDHIKTRNYDARGTTSDDSSSAPHELSNISFGSSPYEMRLLSDWMSSCLPYEQSEVIQYDPKSHGYGKEGSGVYSCFCYPSWSCEEEEIDASIWDISSSFWS